MTLDMENKNEITLNANQYMTDRRKSVDDELRQESIRMQLSTP